MPRPRLLPVLTTLIVFHTIGAWARPDLGHAFSPAAAAAIAERIPGALPPAASWNPSWGEAAAVEATRQASIEDHDLESHEPWRHWSVGATLSDPSLDEASRGAAMVIGLAPRRLERAARELRDAFVDGDDAAIVAALARVARTASDLGDPFHMTSPGLDEVGVSRARFSDLLTPLDVAALESRDREPPGDPIAAAMALAEESAQWRSAIEDAVQAEEHASLVTLRRERLESALSLASAIAVGAWREARSTAVASSPVGLGTLRIWPNPARQLATLAFSLPDPGEARLEIFDSAGRRVAERSLGWRRAGAQGAGFGPALLGPLAPGLYLVSVTSGNYRAAARVAHLRD